MNSAPVHKPVAQRSIGRWNLSDLTESGETCESSGIAEWWDQPIPAPTLETLILASLYLKQSGLPASGEDLSYYLAAEIARARHEAVELTEDLLRLKARHRIERGMHDDEREHNEILEQQLVLAKAEAKQYRKAQQTAQERLVNALAAVDDLSKNIDWNELLNG